MNPAAGVDGCRKGWACVLRDPDGATRALKFPDFATLVDALPSDATIAVDMPIGLPERVGHGGRGPEQLVRKLLGARQSSVFSIPSRAAVYAECEPFTTLAAWYDAHSRACRIARETSDPPRAISIQAFAIFDKIRELDTLLRERPQLRERVIESHPEAAFRQLNGHRAMRLPKKVRGKVDPAGMAERIALLRAHGLAQSLFERPPGGVAMDDLVDAAAMLLVAERHAAEMAISFPDPPGRDAYGLAVAIWT